MAPVRSGLEAVRAYKPRMSKQEVIAAALKTLRLNTVVLPQNEEVSFARDFQWKK